jgi:glutathione S-transferase
MQSSPARGCSDEDAIVKAIPNAQICIAEIARLLNGSQWLAGDAISLADLLLAPHLSMFALAPEGVTILADHENLRSWLVRIETRPSMAATTWDRLLERVAAAA